MSYSDIVRAALAKESGLPLEPAPAPDLLAPSVEPVPAVDSALQSFDAGNVPVAVGVTQGQTGVEVPPVLSAQSDIVQRALAKEKGLPYQAPAASSPAVTGSPVDMLRGAPASEPAPAAAHVVRVIEPAKATPTEVVRVIEPVAAPSTATTEQPADTESATLGMSVQDIQKDLSKYVDDVSGASERIGEARAKNAEERAARANTFMTEFDELNKEHGDTEKAALEGVKRVRGEYEALNAKVREMPPISGPSGLKKAMGGIAVALGQAADHNNLVAGLMQGMNVQTHNADAIQGQLNTAAERDISLQKTNLEKERATAQDKLTELGVARQYFGDTQQAHRFAVALRKERYAAEMEQQAFQLESATARDLALMDSARARFDGVKERDDVVQTMMGTKLAALQAIAEGRMTPAQATAFIGDMGAGGAADGTPTAAQLKEMERAKQAELMRLAGGNANQRGQGQIEAFESSYDDFSKTKPADWYNETRTNKADDARESYVQLETVYGDAAQALRTIKSTSATQDEKLNALTTYNEAREAVPQLLVAALGGGAAAEGEAARASKNWPTVPNPNANDLSSIAGAGDAAIKGYWDKYARQIDARPEAIDTSLNSVTRRHYAVMNELGHRHKSWAPASAPTTQPSQSTTPVAPTAKPTAPKNSKPASKIPGLVYE